MCPRKSENIREGQEKLAAFENSALKLETLRCPEHCGKTNSSDTRSNTK